MRNILSYLEESAYKYPNKIAVIDENETCTFGELKNKAQVIGCNILRNMNVDYYINNDSEEDECIVVFMDKSVKTLEAFMGIVYAGCFYCLLDPSFPKDRIKQILDVTNTKHIITDKKNIGKLNGIEYDGHIYDVEE